ncbi:hypothetical protein [Streptomyces sp. NPDC001348]
MSSRAGRVTSASLLVAASCAALLLPTGAADLAHSRVRGMVPLVCGVGITVAAFMVPRRGTKRAGRRRTSG